MHETLFVGQRPEAGLPGEAMRGRVYGDGLFSAGIVLSFLGMS